MPLPIHLVRKLAQQRAENVVASESVSVEVSSGFDFNATPVSPAPAPAPEPAPAPVPEPTPEPVAEPVPEPAPEVAAELTAEPVSCCTSGTCTGNCICKSAPVESESENGDEKKNNN